MVNRNKIVITGTAGFLGGRVAKYFAKRFTGYQIVATSRRNTRAQELENKGCKFISGDLCSQNFCNEITRDAEIVVHCAALSAPYGEYDAFYHSNFVATDCLLKASVVNKVKRFVFISTPSIYFNFSDRFNVKESDTFPPKMVNYYAKTKLMAEEKVLSMNGKGIETIALRPRAIIGAEDTVIFPRVFEAYHKGKLKIIGKGDNVCDFTCVGNVIEAIVCSIQAGSNACGKAFNITDGLPVVFWEALNYALNALSLAPPAKKIPKWLAMFVAHIIEGKAYLFKEKKEPVLTRYGIGILSLNFTMDISEAKRLLNYQPVMSTWEGINEYIQWYKARK